MNITSNPEVTVDYWERRKKGSEKEWIRQEEREKRKGEREKVERKNWLERK